MIGRIYNQLKTFSKIALAAFRRAGEQTRGAVQQWLAQQTCVVGVEMWLAQQTHGLRSF